MILILFFIYFLKLSDRLTSFFRKRQKQKTKKQTYTKQSNEAVLQNRQKTNKQQQPAAREVVIKLSGTVQSCTSSRVNIMKGIFFFHGGLFWPLFGSGAVCRHGDGRRVASGSSGAETAGGCSGFQDQLLQLLTPCTATSPARTYLVTRQKKQQQQKKQKTN